LPLPPDLEARSLALLARVHGRPRRPVTKEELRRVEQELEIRRIVRESRRQERYAEVRAAIRAGLPLPPTFPSRFPTKLD
jgi:hypothetical protein